MNRSQSYCFHGIVTISFFLFLHLLLNTLASPSTQSKCRHDQRDALLELKEEFTTAIRYNDNKYRRTMIITTNSWNKSAECCSWDGVTCDAESGKVISLKLVSGNDGNYTSLKSSSSLFKLKHLRTLDLSFYNLQGEIPSSFWNLSHLTHLALSFCNLQGEIPSSFWNLSHLTFLDLKYCNLYGEIPSSIGNLSHLTFLDLSSNRLGGEVPVSIGNLNQLRHIDLSRNDFSGNIPTSFANLTKLETLNLNRNQYTGGNIVLANLTNLSYIDLAFNNFTSSISADLSGLQKLERFLGSDNSFVGFFPSSLLMIPSLYHIDLRRNQFEGPIDFGNTSSLSQLLDLTIRYNNFDGLISKSISKLRNLKSLDLSHNNFVGRVPISLSKLANLSYIDLSYNKLEGEVPHCLWTSCTLLSADLSHNSFRNFGKSEEVVDGASLSYLDLRSNSLQGPIPQWICKLPLTNLVLLNNHFTGSIPQCLKSSTSLIEVNMRNNNLSGFLPDLCTNNGSELRSLDVSHNNLKGKLPKSLMNCMSMVVLNVKGNKIKDKFPFWLGSLSILLLGSNAFYGPVYNSSAYLGFPSLTIIDISNNNFVGSLPQDYFSNWTKMSLSNEDYRDWEYSMYVGHPYPNYEDSIEMVYKGVDTDFFRIFKDFKAIDFSGNGFSGYIPGSIGRLSGLRLLNLSGNTFTGSIPPSLANITMLEILDLSENKFSGKIPPVLGNLSFLSYINFSHNHLEGLVPQSTQFGSQQCSSFVGNSGLYGLEQICGEIHVPIPTSQQPEESLSEQKEQIVNWIAVAIAYGPGVFCGLVIGHIFISYKHEWFMKKFGRNKQVHTT